MQVSGCQIQKNTDTHALLIMAGLACSVAQASYGTFVSANCVNGYGID
jgi:hypothetical protein